MCKGFLIRIIFPSEIMSYIYLNTFFGIILKIYSDKVCENVEEYYSNVKMQRDFIIWLSSYVRIIDVYWDHGIK